VNLGNVQGGSALRRGWPRQLSAMGFAVVVGVFGLVGIHSTERRADAAALEWPAGPDPAPFAELPVPPKLLMTPETEPTTTTTAPPETTTTTAPPVETTTTTQPPPPAPPPATSPPPAPPRPRVASSGPQAQAQVEGIADSSGWDWRAAGVRFNLSFYPRDCCHWGVYEAATSIIWVGPTAFSDPNRLRYVVLHELAHAWQYRQNRFAQFISDYTAWGFATIGPALEAGADCVAAVWGAGGGHYWSCPADARALATRRLRGDWR
jgi:hypothetical protein